MAYLTPDAAALDPAALSDDALMQAQRDLASARQTLEAAEARVAAEVGHRSSREFGYDGLAARHGMRSGEQLVQVLSGASIADARRLVRVGTLVGSGAVAEPWLRPALGLPVGAVDAVRAGLGSPNSAVPPDALASAARQLAAEAPGLDVDALARRARQLRTELDLDSIGLREEERRAERYLRLTPLPTGMTRISGLLDPESAAIVVGAVDAVTAPRRGGPRFVASEEPAVDERTPEQLMLDALVDMVSVATRAPSGRLFSQRKPSVKVLVTARELAAGHGAAFIEGHQDAVSIATAQRHVCSAGLVPILFDQDGQGMDLGRDERLHSARQREVITARDGGCVGPDCDRPPSWTEVHHIVPWSEGGVTSVEDGVLLCRYHHMLVHNQGWRITRTGAEYSLVPPSARDPKQVPIPIGRRSAVVRRLLEVAG